MVKIVRDSWFPEEYWLFMTDGFDFELDENDKDDAALLLEFEKMLDGEVNKYDKLKDKDTPPPIPKCDYHDWIKSGLSPNTGVQWWNCKKCSMPKEQYEEELKKQLTNT